MADIPSDGAQVAGRAPHSRGRRVPEVAGFLLIWLIAVEVLLRLFFVSPARIAYDAAIGWHHAPNSSFLMPVQDNGYREISTNALGLHNPPIGPKAGRKRVLVLGDSYVEAAQLPRRDSFIGILAHARPAFDFVNLGRAGLDPLDEAIYFNELAPKLHPDGAIMVVNFGDQFDIESSQPRIARCGADNVPCSYSLPVEHRSASRELFNRIESYSALVTLLALKYQSIFERPHIDLIDRFISIVGERKEKVTRPVVARSDLEPLTAAAFKKVIAHVPLLVIYVPTLDYQLDGKTSAPLANGWKEIVEAAARQAGADFVDMGPAFAQVYARTGQPPVGYDFNRVGIGHPNRAGHAAIAAAIERHLNLFRHGASGG